MLFRGRNHGGFAGLADRLHARLPVGELLLGLVLRDAVELLDPAQQHVALAGDDVELILGELAPLLQGIALELLPVAFDAVPVHGRFLFWLSPAWDPRLRPSVWQRAQGRRRFLRRR